MAQEDKNLESVDLLREVRMTNKFLYSILEELQQIKKVLTEKK